MPWISGSLKDTSGNQVSNKTKANDIILENGQTLEQYLSTLETWKQETDDNLEDVTKITFE